MTSEADETVEDVLAELSRDNPEVRPLYAALYDRSSVSYADLSVSDWLSAVKLSGGKVVIELRLTDLPNLAVYVTRGKDGMLLSHGPCGLQRDSYTLFRAAVESDDIELCPVLRDDTPFSGENV